MNIQAFYRKFTSKNEQGSLFEGLRGLSLVDDFKSMFREGDDMMVEWMPWPPSGVDAPCEA